MLIVDLGGQAWQCRSFGSIAASAKGSVLRLNPSTSWWQPKDKQDHDCHFGKKNLGLPSDDQWPHEAAETLLRLAALSWQDPNSGSTTSSQTAWGGCHICEVLTFWKNQQLRSNLLFWLFCTGFWDHGTHWETYGFSVKSIPPRWHSLEVKYR